MKWLTRLFGKKQDGSMESNELIDLLDQLWVTRAYIKDNDNGIAGRELDVAINQVERKLEGVV